MELLVEVVFHSLLITSFVLIMMMTVEYLHVVTGGQWLERLGLVGWRQYLVAAVLGASPGCLGAFLVVALHGHGAVSFGALVAAMVATSGDESFVMLGLFPGRAMLLFGFLLLLGAASGATVDRILPGLSSRGPHCHGLSLDGGSREPHPRTVLLGQWRRPIWIRLAIVSAAGMLLALVAAGVLGHDHGSFRAVLAAAAAVGVVIGVVASDQFLGRRAYRHVLRTHGPRLLVWTAGALALTHVALHALPELGPAGRLSALGMAALVGLVPESGPHLTFVTLYAAGAVPASVLITSSIVQDGHGLLPVLAHSRRAFVLVKAIKLGLGLTVGLVWWMIGL